MRAQFLYTPVRSVLVSRDIEAVDKYTASLLPTGH